MAPFEVFCVSEYIHKNCHCFFVALVVKISTPNNEEKLWTILFTKNYKSCLFNSAWDWKSLQTERRYAKNIKNLKPKTRSSKLKNISNVLEKFCCPYANALQGWHKIIYRRFDSFFNLIGFCSYIRIVMSDSFAFNTLTYLFMTQI